MNYACLALGYIGINNWLPEKCGTESITHELESAFTEHLSEYGISYGTMEEFYFRLRHFAAKDAEYNRINSDENNTFTVGHNHMSSWTEYEYKKILGYKGASGELLKDVEAELIAEFDPSAPLADSVDWRTKGAVNPVKNQARCGSCWAFSAVASMEGHHFIKTGKLISLSEQQFVDCDKSSHGCNGGLQEYAMKHSETHGEELETDYTYKGKDGTCAEVSSKGQVKTTKINYVAKHDSQALLAAIALGPVSVTVEADKPVFQGYKTGIMNSKECGTSLDHAITAVGYGEDAGQKYYIVRNSWGATWGDQGYIKIATEDKRFFNYGICGIQQTSLWATTD